MPASAAHLSNVIPVRPSAPRSLEERGATLEVEFRPQDRSVHNVRLMTHSFVQLAVNDHPFASRVTVTCAELVENLARKLPARTCKLRVTIGPVNQRVSVALSAEASEAEAEEVRRVLELANMGDPVESYTRSLMAIGKDSEALLGLARVRYEGQMTLSAIRLGRRLELLAETTKTA